MARKTEEDGTNRTLEKNALKWAITGPAGGDVLISSTRKHIKKLLKEGSFCI